MLIPHIRWIALQVSDKKRMRGEDRMGRVIQVVGQNIICEDRIGYDRIR